jgi:hypothetical protein
MFDDDAEGGFFRSLIPRRPKDAVCLGLAVAASGFIAVNALFLQKGPHPAPFFTDAPAKTASPAAAGNESVPLPPKRQAAGRLPAAPLPSPVKTTGTLPQAAPVPPAPIPVKNTAAPRPENRPDPIADLLEPSNRTVAVQRALAEFGYGQIKPTGTVGPDTKAAIEKFERERKLPVTGQVSDRLVRELSALKGSPL